MNPCRKGNPEKNATSWTLIAATDAIDLTPPILATAWNDNLNFKIGDYYADSSLEKVFKCVGNYPSQATQLRNAEVLCRQKYATDTIGGWEDVTSTVPYQKTFIDMKFPLTKYQGWY